MRGLWYQNWGMKNAQERIYRIWSDKKEDTLSVRIRFTVEEAGSCRMIRLESRDEWC
jgi:hypothetical protein